MVNENDMKIAEDINMGVINTELGVKENTTKKEGD